MGDEVAKTLKDYANNEIVNKSLSSGLENLSITLSAIEEYRNCEVQRLEAKVYCPTITLIIIRSYGYTRDTVVPILWIEWTF